MKLNLLSSLAELCKQNAYAESTRYGGAVAQMHRDFTDRAWSEIVAPKANLKPRAPVLDIGADGYSLEMFHKANFLAVGINAMQEDIDACHAKNLKCHLLDMHDLPADWDAFFDLVWARHVFEHSPFPMLALAEAHRVLRPGGFLYMETPAPGTACRHEMNASHFSVHTNLMWTSLLSRSGFDIIHMDELHFDTLAGPDIYYRWLARKPEKVKP